VVALVVASVVALFLVISPPESDSAADEPRTLATVTPAVVATASPTKAGQQPTPTTSTQATATSTVVSSPSAGAERTHKVVPGDTLSGIAAQYNTTIEAIMALNPGLTENLQIDAVIRIPPAR
jgi:LysM repeat protein